MIVPLSDEVPFAEAGEDTTLNCIFTELVLNGNGSQGANFEYLWTTDDGNILSDETTLFPSINQNGHYIFNVTNLNNGCTVSDEIEVFIDTLSPVATIEIIGPLIIDCDNISTVLDGSSSTPLGLLNFEWTTEDGNIISNENMPNPEVNAAGTYQLTVTNTRSMVVPQLLAFLWMQMWICLKWKLHNPPILSCIDTIIQLDAGNSSGGNEFIYFWETVNGNILDGDTTLFPIVDQPGIYTLNIQNTSNFCESFALVEVLQDIETPVAEAGPFEELDCNTNTATLDGGGSSSGNIFDYSWTTSNGVIISDQNTINPVVGTSGNYLLTVLNFQNGCTATDEVEVTENLDVPNGMDVLIDPPLCFGDFGTINILTVFGGKGPYLYSVDGGDQFSSDTVFQNLPSGTYNVVIQDMEGCLYEEEISIPQVYEILILIEPEVEIDLGESYQINAQVNFPQNQIDTIIWSPKESLSCFDCLDPVAYPIENTIYTVTVFDLNGCFATAEIFFKVDKSRKIYIPNAFSPNNDGVNDVFLIYADAKSVSKINRLQVFDRWGGKVFEIFDAIPNDAAHGWDGTIKGKKMNPSVFVYAAEIEFVDGKTILYKGDLTILE